MPPRAQAHPLARPLDLHADPAHILRAWSADRPLAVLWSAPPLDDRAARWSRWTILAQPIESLRADPAAEADPLALLDSVHTTAWTGAEPPPDAPPFLGGWIGSLSYDLGRRLEPRAGSARAPRPPLAPWPVILLHRCPAAYIHDRLHDRWWSVGRAEDAEGLPALDALTHAAGPDDEPFGLDADDHEASPLRDRYRASVARAVEYIHAGDVFQVNLAHALTGVCTGPARAAFASLVEAAAPWYGAYLEDGTTDARSWALSASPELFFEFDPRSRRILTRPIKGTVRGDAPPGRLAASDKDAAELAMIVDLMRNDLGRVCEFGSVRVAEARALERHGGRGRGVLHGVATVEGRVRPGLGIADLVRAAFPAGSITGAPKVRAMQIIDELEPHARGLYTGSIGYISDHGPACFNVAIRTAVLHGRGRGRWVYGAGAGIVADSEPEAEWDETMAKAEIMLRLCREHPLAGKGVLV